MSNSTINIISVIAAIASAVFAGLIWYYVILQHNIAEKQQQYFKNQIIYIAVLDRKDSNDKYGTLKLQQVSGQPYILTGIWILPSIESKIGGYEEGKPFALSIVEYLQSQDRLPRYEIPNIGQLICHKQSKVGDFTCDPCSTFTVNYRYKVFDDERDYRQALIGRRYSHETQ